MKGAQHSMSKDRDRDEDSNRCPAPLLDNLGTTLIGSQLICYETVSSTNTVARELAMQGAREGTAVLAGQQTEGKGRMGKKWHSSPGSSLLVSAILYPEPAWLPQVNMSGSLATVRCIHETTGLEPSIKWPNDVLIHGKKVAGILFENIFQGTRLKAAILGIGINVTFDPSPMPDIPYPATSLKAESGRETTVRDLLPSLLRHLDQLYLRIKTGGDIFPEWLSVVETVGKPVKVRSGNRIEEGTAESINRDGSLVLRRSDGTRVTMVTGE